MRILGIETSSRRGSVALLEDERCVAQIEHEQPNAHAERILTLLNRAFSEAGWSRTSLDRIAVGTGPGSFVGLRVGIAVAEGLGIGLSRPVVGVSSLQAMLRATPPDLCEARIALLDARRGEAFAAAEDNLGRALLPPCTIPLERLATELLAIAPRPLLIGEILVPDFDATHLRGPHTDLPHARWVAELARRLDPSVAPAVPEYVRGPGATLPKLPPSPLRAQS
ncbi:MAG TPA: tRNA (adenosine(37)-N6)-threonylcarbamoyltransferase complex dimerization subunit type 1 TsaB [Polyangiaceae bacterium]|nr:tRNA (adenosine(37)-N6)-threonylcarbamoyltransferase complex dimerization subunit type 1 TsaB [Polyangiaceae bacterium]